MHIDTFTCFGSLMYSTLDRLQQDERFSPELQFRGRVRLIDHEKKTYAITTDRGEEYLPLNLPSEYQKDLLPVKGRGFIRENLTDLSRGRDCVALNEIKVCARGPKHHLTRRLWERIHRLKIMPKKEQSRRVM